MLKKMTRRKRVMQKKAACYYHGSSMELTELRPGSTVTPDPNLARVFSHKPAVVTMSEDGRLEHTGTLPGYLYRIAEAIGANDVMPHPQARLLPGKEFLTNRELRLELVRATSVYTEERLAPVEALRLLRDQKVGA